MGAIGKAKAAVRLAVQPFRSAQERRQKSPLYTSIHANLDPAQHLSEAADWLKRAQDHGTDRGVSYGTSFGQGFSEASYPETTGYIINTFLALARFYSDKDYEKRARAMGDWEADIQMPSGAVMGGKFNTSPTPAVFNTGMVLLGWAELFRHTQSASYGVAGERAGRWLLDMQEADGNWIRGNSAFASGNSTLYNVKAAWGLAEMGAALGNQEFIAGAVRNAEYALRKQQDNGWFADCCLEDAANPLLHTMAYTMQGLMGVGLVSGRQDFIAGATRTADALMNLMDEDGFIPGKIDRNFKGAVDWCCLTGTAQTAIIWSEIEKQTGDTRYGAAADKALGYLMARHDISSQDLSIRGGLAGSWPVWGDYGKYQILNWATKFLADALLMRLAP